MSFPAVQLLLLDTIMYMKPEEGPFSRLEDYTGRTLADWIWSMDLADWQDEDPEHPPMTTAEEWKHIVEAVKKIRRLMNLKIAAVYTDVSEEGGGCRSALFLSEGSHEAVIVFEGTEVVVGSAQWRDNFSSANLSDSPHQMRALGWYKTICRQFDLNRYRITVTGHSKGGNKAKYVTILDGTPDACVSFNGEGFSDKFFQKYSEKILDRAKLIENHIVNYDYVSLLLNDVGVPVYYHGHNIGSGGFTENHMANTFLRFDEEGNAHMDVDEYGIPDEMAAFDYFCNSYLRSMDDDRRTSSLKTMNAVLDAVLSVDRHMSTDETAHVFLELAEDESHRRNIAYFTAYVIRYGQEDPDLLAMFCSVLSRFDLDGIVQYVQLASQIMNWQGKLFFVHLNFLTLTTIAATVVRYLPNWVLNRMAGDIAKKGIHFTTAQMKQLQMILIQAEVDLRTISVEQEKTDRTVTA